MAATPGGGPADAPRLLIYDTSLMSVQPLKIAILAMGGEGGGVLADWLVDLGEHAGFIGQSTSVPGVAQRTGATIYYVELFPGAPGAAHSRAPVLALMPMPGDVDIVLASELMEAGRAVQRGLVTPDRTTLVASTHRVYSITEKSAMGDGRVDSAELMNLARTAAKHSICHDMAKVAETSGSVISAVLFGALCGAGVLPFSRAQFEATIERGGVGVAASLRAFGAGLSLASGETPPSPSITAVPAAASAIHPPSLQVANLLERLRREYPPSSQPMLIEGVRRLVDYQDPAYAHLYLDRLARLWAIDRGKDERLFAETARHLALWMSYEDIMRVADLKTRNSRFDRVRREVSVKDGQLLEIGEFMHPRMEEICDALPAPLGRWLLRPHWAHRCIARMLRNGRVVRTSSLGGFLLLYGLSGWSRARRRTLRYAVETARIESWLAQIAAAAERNSALALEIAKCQQLVKGYGDTHVRGFKNFATLMGVVERRAATLAPATLSELRVAALADEHGKALNNLLVKTSLL